MILTKNTVVALQNIEVNRMTYGFKSSANKQVSYSNQEDEDSNELDEVLSHICRDLTENSEDDGSDHISMVPSIHLKNKKVDAFKSKGKYGRPPNNTKKSKTPKKPKTKKGIQ